MHIKLNNISYSYANNEPLFTYISFAVSYNKTALIGDNGTGKSTLLKIISGEIIPNEGSVISEGSIVMLPQDFSIYNNQTVAEVLSIKEKLSSLENILVGNSTQFDYEILNEEWDLPERIKDIFCEAKLEEINLERRFDTLSGGEKSRLLFASLLLNKPDFALLDEPTNHLDTDSRNILYSLIKNYRRGLLIVSHDRELLNLMDEINELSPKGMKTYGGNYDFYKEQKQIEREAALNTFEALNQQHKKSIKEKNAALEKQAKRAAAGKKKMKTGGIPKIAKNYLQDNSMKTLTRLKDSHSEKIETINSKLIAAKEKLENSNSLMIDLNSSEIPSQKMILEVKDLNFKFGDSENFLWKENINFSISGSERWSIAGINGCGKSVLLQLILGKFHTSEGEIKLHSKNTVFLDQNVEILDSELSVYENLKNYSDKFSEEKIPEHELRIRLARFLFRGEDAFKKVKVLSGGEKIRAGLACIMASGTMPELLILDEPSNNLDLKSLEELTGTLNSYKGALLVVSHDKRFLNEIQIEKQLVISRTEKHKQIFY
ncbi:MAG: ABC-F family ATP-binding cassette domain-containing protein [Bacteroidetes bacterium]|nr:ABC-F family ATP-binding cassette domain-containing protein [Bacteroidota bacterium]